jgi:hypothetical protein
MAENTGTKTTSQAAPGTKAAGNTIDADSYRQMVTILDQLRQHTHTFTDDYTTNCQCNCGRGSL